MPTTSTDSRTPCSATPLNYKSLLVHALVLASSVHASAARLSSLQTRDDGPRRDLIITNKCSEDIWPAIATQNGPALSEQGYRLASGESKNQTVPFGWIGRVWGRTNCTFPNPNSPREACVTGDCNGVLDCKVTGQFATLAEIAFDADQGKTFYDLSNVDGFNLPIAMVLTNSNRPPNITNPSCVASVANLSDDFNPYGDGEQQVLNSNNSFPIKFNLGVSRRELGRWCPWDNQLQPPVKPGDNIYPYPDDNIQRPVFQPCLSSCSKWGAPADCCTGKYVRGVCRAGLYAKKVKSVCPDAYSFAMDDQDSMFDAPAGVGIKVVFCPGGQSTNIKGVGPTVDAKTLARFALKSKSKKISERSTITPRSESSAAGSDFTTMPWMFMVAALVLTAGVFSML